MSFGTIWKPQAFQGSLKSKKYFEGWYYKNIDMAGDHACAVIPGIALSRENPHAFVQVFDRALGTALYFRYPVHEFEFKKDEFRVTIGASIFSLEEMRLDCHDDANNVTGRLAFKGQAPWPVSFFSPGAMGPFRFVPFMECYHGVLSFDHEIEGSITINGRNTEYSGGRGYIEKDWGRGMPSSWIWLQSNHFTAKGVSFFCSVAAIPWLGTSFRGFIMGLYLYGRLFRFATYTGASIRLLEGDGAKLRLIVQDPHWTLEVDAAKAPGVDLPTPREGLMAGHVNESLRSTVSVTLTDRKAKTVIFSGTGSHAGVEFTGEYDRQVGEKKPPTMSD